MITSIELITSIEFVDYCCAAAQNLSRAQFGVTQALAFRIGVCRADALHVALMNAHEAAHFIERAIRESEDMRAKERAAEQSA